MNINVGTSWALTGSFGIWDHLWYWKPSIKTGHHYSHLTKFNYRKCTSICYKNKKNDKALYTLGISLKIKSHFTILQMSNKMILHFAFFIGTIKYSTTLRLSNEYNQPSLREVLFLLFEREIKGLNKNFARPFKINLLNQKKRILSSNELATNSLFRADFNWCI